MLEVLRRIVKGRENKKDEPADIVMKIRELFDQGRKVAVQTCPAKLDRHKAKIASLRSDLEVKELELHTLPRLVEEAAGLS